MITIKCGEFEKTFGINEQNEEHIEIPIVLGENEIKIESSAQDLEVEGDPRKLNICIYKLDIEINNETVHINNPTVENHK